MTNDRDVRSRHDRERDEELERMEEAFVSSKSGEQIDKIIEVVGVDAIAEHLYQEFREKLTTSWAEELAEK